MPAGSRSTPVKTFTAPSLPLALEMVRRELGPEALILETRELRPQKWQFWRRQARQVCVTATLDAQAPTRFLWRTPLPGINATYEVEHTTPTPNGLAPGSNLGGGGSVLPAFGARPRALPLPPVPGTSPTPISEISPAPPALRPGRGASHTVAPASTAAPVSDRQAQLELQLAELQQRLAALSGARTSAGPDLANSDLRRQLQLLGMEDELVVALEQAVHSRFPEPIGFERALPLLRTALQDRLLCAPPMGVRRGERTVIALVGPSGAGKTTTLAKLAANLHATGCPVAILSLAAIGMGHGPSAAEQSGLSEIPHDTVRTTTELEHALQDCASAEVVLLDTAGRNPRHPPHWHALRDQLDVAQPHEIHLVLSPSGPSRATRELTRPFLDLGANRLLLTKLDELPVLGVIPSLARELGLPISYLSLGSQIPDDLEHANARRLARLVLRDELLSDPFRAPE